MLAGMERTFVRGAGGGSSNAFERDSLQRRAQPAVHRALNLRSELFERSGYAEIVKAILLNILHADC